MTGERNHRGDIVKLIGIAAVAFSALYFVSDLIELIHGGFSTFQLVFTYAAEAAIPLFVLGLYAVQRPQIGRLGLIGALAYAYTFVYFTSTVVYALVDHTRDWDALKTQLGTAMTVHSVLMVLAGVTFAAAVVRAHVLPRWTGITLIAGMVLMTVTVSLPDATRTLAAGVRDLAFAGMGVSLLRRPRPIQTAVAARRRRHTEATRQSRPTSTVATSQMAHPKGDHAPPIELPLPLTKV
jgi:hypothetical protein